MKLAAFVGVSILFGHAEELSPLDGDGVRVGGGDTEIVDRLWEEFRVVDISSVGGGRAGVVAQYVDQVGDFVRHFVGVVVGGQVVELLGVKLAGSRLERG